MGAVSAANASHFLSRAVLNPTICVVTESAVGRGETKAERRFGPVEHFTWALVLVQSVADSAYCPLSFATSLQLRSDGTSYSGCSRPEDGSCRGWRAQWPASRDAYGSLEHASCERESIIEPTSNRETAANTEDHQLFYEPIQ